MERFVDLSSASITGTSLNDKDWEAAVAAMEFSFQPIANIRTGLCIGYEALLNERGRERFHPLDAVFSGTHSRETVTRASILLIGRAIEPYARSDCAGHTKLFLNIDSRVLPESDLFLAALEGLLKEQGVPPPNMVLEISGNSGANEVVPTPLAFREIRTKGINIALDNYGIQRSGPQLLYQANPHYIKISPFFIGRDQSKARRKLIIGNMISTAHMFGCFVIAQGVDTREDFFFFKELGCDMAQGDIVRNPDGATRGLRNDYHSIEELNKRDKRNYGSDVEIIHNLMETAEPVRIAGGGNFRSADVNAILASFRENNDLDFLPAVNEHGEPLGIIQENKFKEYGYSAYGISLLKHRGLDMTPFIAPCPAVEITTTVEHLLEVFTLSGEGEGILLTQEGKYRGFLRAKPLLMILHEKNMATARDQNPLSKLPGNVVINEFIAAALQASGHDHAIVYFDFDNFKPFNDKHGFRDGDKAILIFGDLLKELAAQGAFAGHIGGDDFFAGFRDDMKCHPFALELVMHTVSRFAKQVAQLYSLEERKTGNSMALDREGQVRFFPLLSVSAAVLNIPKGGKRYTLEDIGGILANLKKSAKQSDTRVAVASIGSAL